MVYAMAVFYMALLVIMVLPLRKTETLGPFIAANSSLEEQCIRLVRQEHVWVAVIVMLISFNVTSGYSYLSSAIPCLLLGWLFGERWARLRVRHVQSIPVEPEEVLSCVAQQLNETSTTLIQAKTVSIRPLPLRTDLVIMIGCVVAGCLLGLVAKSLAGLCC